MNDADTYNAVLRAALKTYRLMGGTDAERQPPRAERAEEPLANILPPPVNRVPLAIQRRDAEEEVPE